MAAVETNSDGHTLNVARPSIDGRAELLQRVYECAGIDPNDLAFAEAHGAGMLAGDPIEAAAPGRVLGRRRREPLPIGSIKSSIGHLEPASGAAGVLKALFALMNRCDADVPFTRITEHRHFSPWEAAAQKSVCFREFSRDAGAGDIPTTRCI